MLLITIRVRRVIILSAASSSLALSCHKRRLIFALLRWRSNFKIISSAQTVSLKADYRQLSGRLSAGTSNYVDKTQAQGQLELEI